MLPPIPYLDIPGYTRRCKVAPADVDVVEQLYPGYIAHRIARGSSWINARLQKRYRVPLGQEAPTLVATGTSPPAALLTGRPVLGSLEVTLGILLAGALGTATFWWSSDGGDSWNLGPELAATGTSPPAVGVTGTGALDAPEDLAVAITGAGALGTARFQWSDDGGSTWNIASAMAATGTSPPAVTLAGVSSLALPSDLQVEITTAGPLGTAYFQWSQDGGVTWTTGVQTTAVPIPLGTTGLTATFALGTYATNNAYQGQGVLTEASYELGTTGFTLGFPAGTYGSDNAYAGQGIVTAATYSLDGTGLTVTLPVGTYSADNVFTASTPVPELALGWLCALVDVDVWQRRGTNSQDPTIVDAKGDRDAALGEIKEAADSKEGLVELPTIDTMGDSAISKGGPLFYTEASPYVSADRQEFEGVQEDERRRGTYGGS